MSSLALGMGSMEYSRLVWAMLAYCTYNIVMQHMVRVSLENGRRTALTVGTFTVNKIIDWDRGAGVV